MSDIYCIYKGGATGKTCYGKFTGSLDALGDVPSLECRSCGQDHIALLSKTMMITEGNWVQGKEGRINCYGKIINPADETHHLGKPALSIKCYRDACTLSHHVISYDKFFDNWDVNPELWIVAEDGSHYGDALMCGLRDQCHGGLDVKCVPCKKSHCMPGRIGFWVYANRKESERRPLGETYISRVGMGCWGTLIKKSSKGSVGWWIKCLNSTCKKDIHRSSSVLHFESNWSPKDSPPEENSFRIKTDGKLSINTGTIENTGFSPHHTTMTDSVAVPNGWQESHKTYLSLITGENMNRIKIDNAGAQERISEILIEALEATDGVTLVYDNQEGMIYGWIDDEENLVGSPIGFKVTCTSNEIIEEHLQQVMEEIKTRRSIRENIADLPSNEG